MKLIEGGAVVTPLRGECLLKVLWVGGGAAHPVLLLCGLVAARRAGNGSAQQVFLGGVCRGGGCSSSPVVCVGSRCGLAGSLLQCSSPTHTCTSSLTVLTAPPPLSVVVSVCSCRCSPAVQGLQQRRCPACSCPHGCCPPGCCGALAAQGALLRLCSSLHAVVGMQVFVWC